MNIVTGSATALAVLLVLGGCAASPNPESGESPSSEPADFTGVPLVPAEGVYLGMYYGDREAAETDDAIGVTPQIHLTYFGWEDPWATDMTLTDDLARGQISLVNWEPFEVNFADIVDGTFDGMLTQRARQAAELTQPVFLDFAAEMNEEEGWGGHDPELYVAAYRHIHDIFDANDANQIVWVWAPNNVDSQNAPAALEYYPGDDYVDWTGIDGYNWGTSDPNFEWQSFESVFRAMYDDLHGLGKPIIIGEMASAEEGGSKPQWIEHVVPTLEQEFSDIRAVVWFDVDKERDWRIRSSLAAEAAFADVAADPLFRAAQP